MGTYRIVDIAREYLFGGDAFLRSHSKSWLLYDPPPDQVQEAMSTMTLTSPAVSRKGFNPKTANQPTAIEISQADKPNRFPLGITVGRTDESDIVLADDSISRLHSYFQ